jgi:hypothetical protein
MLRTIITTGIYYARDFVRNMDPLVKPMAQTGSVAEP